MLIDQDNKIKFRLTNSRLVRWYILEFNGCYFRIDLNMNILWFLCIRQLKVERVIFENFKTGIKINISQKRIDK